MYIWIAYSSKFCRIWGVSSLNFAEFGEFILFFVIFARKKRYDKTYN